MLSFFLAWLMFYCFVNAVFGRQIKRLVRWLTSKPTRREAIYQPDYEIGQWRAE